jgi:hypothetical protein
MGSFLASLLFGVAPTDPATYGAVTAALAGVVRNSVPGSTLREAPSEVRSAVLVSAAANGRFTTSVPM